MAFQPVTQGDYKDQDAYANPPRRRGSGPGYPPPEAVKLEMEQEHGFNHNFQQEITENLIKELEGVKGKYTMMAKQQRKYPYAKPEGN